MSHDDIEQGGIRHARHDNQPCPSGQPYPHTYSTDCQWTTIARGRTHPDGPTQPAPGAAFRRLNDFELPTVAALRLDLEQAHVEINRLRADLEDRLAKAQENARHAAQAYRRRYEHAAATLARVEDLISYTDGNPIDDNAEIQVGEIRRALNAPLPDTPEDTRMSLTPAAIEYLNGTRSATTGDGSFCASAQAGVVEPGTQDQAVRSLDNHGYPMTSQDTRELLASPRYVMATEAHHQFAGDISRDTPALAVIEDEIDTHWIGQWVTGLGFLHVHFPKDTTRPLTDEEISLYDGRQVEAGNGMWTIRIPRPGGTS